ncbi:MAG: tol-pal system-associated acyl-CoA thioesterase [Burkholderiales bacterium]|nr:tol-pal system-associated acyl-CoA thioesterase [Burkholderiales bacterium]
MLSADPIGRPKIDSPSANEPFVWPSRVYYEDTDTSGVVYHANYLKFFERARTEWLRTFGFDQESLKRDHAVVFALRRMELDFLRAARLDDMLEVSVVPAVVKKVYLVLAQEARRGADVVARARVQVACLEYPGLAPRTIPEFIQQKMHA